jgi:hypothetical protein
MEPPEPPKSFIEKLQERLAASRFFTVSLLLHAVLIVMGGSVVLFKHYTEVSDFTSSDGLVNADAQVQAPPDTPQDTPQTTMAPQAPNLSAPSLSAISTNNATTPTFQVAAAVPVVKAVQSDAMADALKKASSAKGLAAGIPGAMGGRIGGSKQRMMDQNGGKKESEIAVQKGLKWLVEHQSSDGSWGPANQGAMTGFALLAFLGHGETPVSADYGPTVQKGFDWLVENGKRHAGRLSMADTFTQPGVYEHAIATYALGEYYTMTKDERVADLLKQAIGYIVKGQDANGGWQYGYAQGAESDTSVSGWQIQALKAAHLSGLNIDGVDPALDKAMLNLKRVQAGDGSFGYKKAGDRDYSLDGAGVLCTYFWKQEKDKSVREGIEHMMKMTDTKYPVDYHHEKADLYAWYYNTQACLMVGGAAWSKWNRLFQDQIIKNQNPDGSWPPVAGKSPGGDLQRDPEGAGPYYRTCLCILMLEVYYRYSPTMKN